MKIILSEEEIRKIIAQYILREFPSLGGQKVLGEKDLSISLFDPEVECGFKISADITVI